MATSDSPLSVPDVTLAVARGAVPPPAPGQRVISGTGFGSGPNVVLFDRFAGTDGEVLSGTRQADIGQWTAKYPSSGYECKLYEDRGRTWFAQRDPSALGINDWAKSTLFLDLGGDYTEFRFSHRIWVPTDKWFPAATAPGVFPSASSWKPSWLAQSNGQELTGFGGGDGQSDVIFDTHMGSGQIGNAGNSTLPVANTAVEPDNTTRRFYGSFSFSAPIFTTFYQSGAESSETAFDQAIEYTHISDVDNFRRVKNDCNPFSAGGEDWATLKKSYSGLNLGGWFGNATDYSQVMPLIADCYLAVGPNSRACIITSDAATLSGSNESYIVAPDSWSDLEIKFTPKGGEALSYTHVILADGTLLENVATEGVAGAPSLSGVSGTFSQGNSLVISGSNISANRNGQMFYDALDAGTVGADALTGFSGDAGAYLVDDTNTPANKAKCARLTQNEGLMPAAYYVFPADVKEFWMHCDMRLDIDPNKLSGIDGPQIKLFRVSSEAGTHTATPYLGWAYQRLDTDPWLTAFESGWDTTTTANGVNPQLSGQWHRWSLGANLGTVGNADGYSCHKTSFSDDAQNGSGYSSNDPNELYPDKSWKFGARQMLDGTENALVYKGILLPFYHRDYQNTSVGLSNLWMNDSPEMVLFANAETFELADTTSVVNQPMVRRESGEIEVICQEGPNGELSTGPVYAFVFNKDGSYNETGLQVRAA